MARIISVRLYLDTNIFIDIVEGRSPCKDAIQRLLSDADAGIVQIVTSELTYAEVLIKPLELNHRRAIKTYREFLLSTDGVELVPITLNVLDAAARLRATSTPKPKLPDAIHIATSKRRKCQYFVTHDDNIRNSHGIKILTLQNIQDNIAVKKVNIYNP